MGAEATQSCPDPATLAAYARDDLDTGAAPALDRHLHACSRCREQYLRDLGRQLLVPEVPDCHVVKEIGRGRFGVVYKAWWLAGAPRLVALKVLNSVGEMERGRFEREIAVLRHLDAPGIVRCLHAGGSGDSAYFIMDYVEGVHFDEYLKDRSMSLDEKLEVFERVCRVVALAHAHGIVHRDIKPRNIIVDEGGQPHVLDFGICSVDSVDRSSWALGTLTHPGDVIGTLRYMSPEQAWGGVAGPIDERSDIWSLGIMLYELVTEGAYPYSLEPTPDHSAHEALLERIRKELPTIPRLENVPGGRQLRTLLERCLTWEPDQRIASASLLADDIAAYRRRGRIRTRPLSPVYRMKRLAVGIASRSRLTFAVAAVALVAVVLSAASLRGAISWKESTPAGSTLAPADQVAAPSQSIRNNILIAGVSDESVRAIGEYAASSGLDRITQDARTWRPLHARLLRRLLHARPRAVVWDYYFTSAQPADAELAEAMLNLERAGVPVVLATDSYDELGRPQLAPGLIAALGDRLRHGAIATQDLMRREGDFVIAIRLQSGVTIPSLWLTVLAAVLHPDAQLEIDWPDRTQPLTLMYAVKPGLYRRERDTLHPTRAFATERSAGAVAPDSLLAVIHLNMSDPREWETRTLPYHHLLRCSDEELTQRVEGKILLIGDLRTRGGAPIDRHNVRYRGKTISGIAGCYLVAEAVAGLLARSYVRAPLLLPPGLMLTAMCCAILGWMAPIRMALWRTLEKPIARRALYAGLTATCAASFVWLVTTDSLPRIFAAVMTFAATFTMLGSFWVEFTRNRHRVAERQRRVIENFGFESAGTLTLPQTRLTSIPEIR